MAAIAALAALWSGYEAHKARVDDERPFIAVDVSTEKNFDGKSALYDLHINSVGKSPAKNIVLTYSDAAEDDKMDIPWVRGENIDTGTFTFSCILPSRSVDLSTGALDLSVKAPYATAVYGFVTYQDEGGTQYRTPYCFDVYSKGGELPYIRQCSKSHDLPELR